MKKILFLSLTVLLLAACSADNEPQSGTTAEQMEIKLTGGIQSVETSTRGAGVISGTLPASTLNVNFARVDATDATPTYPAYTTLSSALAATVGTSGAITFGTTQYYLANGYNSKLVGWYPVATPALGVLTFTLDGSTDVMLTDEQTGNKAANFSTLTFAHKLTQIQIQAYAEDAAAQTLWGDITAAIQIKNQSPSCTITLPSTVTFSGTAGDVAMSIASATLPVGSSSAVSCGYAMIPPAAALQINVTTASGGTKTIDLPTQAYAAGTAYVISLLFKSTGISPTVAITAWTTQTIATPVDIQ